MTITERAREAARREINNLEDEDWKLGHYVQLALDELAKEKDEEIARLKELVSGYSKDRVRTKQQIAEMAKLLDSLDHEKELNQFREELNHCSKFCPACLWKEMKGGQ